MATTKINTPLTLVTTHLNGLGTIQFFMDNDDKSWFQADMICKVLKYPDLEALLIDSALDYSEFSSNDIATLLNHRLLSDEIVFRIAVNLDTDLSFAFETELEVAIDHAYGLC